jgi:hypothetical protein
MLQRYVVGSIGDDEEQRAYCPRHEEPGESNSPSASFNWGKGVWYCQSCEGTGRIDVLIRDLKTKRGDVAPPRRRARSREERPAKEPANTELPTENQLMAWHSRLAGLPERMTTLLQKRGLSEDVVDEFLIGWDGYRYTIPIRDAEGALVNVRRYKPDTSKVNDKMISIAGHGTGRIWPMDQLRAADVKKVVLTEGEMDMLCGRSFGLPTWTHTSGAGAFPREAGELFGGKDVYVCYDCDDAGRAGARRTARIVHPYASMVCIVDLKLDTKGGDLTDFFVSQGHPLADFEAMMLEAADDPWQPPVRPMRAVAATVEVDLVHSEAAETGEPFSTVGQVIGRRPPVYLAPKIVELECEMDRTVCPTCPMNAMGGRASHTIAPNSDDVLRFVDANDRTKREVFQDMFGARCRDGARYEVRETQPLEEVYLSPPPDAMPSRTSVVRQVYSVATTATPIKEIVEMTGAQLPFPKDGRAVILAWKLEQMETDMSSFRMTAELKSALDIFAANQRANAVASRLTRIARDQAANVTKIYGRDMLHIMIDLVYHSVSAFTLRGKHESRGWLDMCIIGDPRTGKSDCAKGLARYYGLGEFASCEGATYAGLVGGVQQLNGKAWATTWGIIPLNDGGLVILDEAGVMKDAGIIEQMSSLRQDGLARITKISSEVTTARTRLVWICNPTEGTRLGDAPGAGLLALSSLYQMPEDLARLDLAMAVSSGSVDIHDINYGPAESEVEHVYTPELARQLVLWAWTRTAEQVIWGRGAEVAVLDLAAKLASQYVDEPPLVQAANIRIKVARLAAAIAARVFSTNRSGELLVVLPCHVQVAERIFKALYADPIMGYAQHSDKMRRAHDKARANRERTKVWLLSPAGEGVRRALELVQGGFRLVDLTDYGAMEREEAREALRVLIVWNMVRRGSNGQMYKQPELVSILGEIGEA